MSAQPPHIPRGLVRTELEAALEAFVNTHAGMRQREGDWYKAMGTTVGGSEIAAIMGINPYSTFVDVVRSKVAALGGGSTWTGGGDACWWGVLFEDVIAAYVAEDLGGRVMGDEICVQVVEGHRNSPDGYIVARFYDRGGSVAVCTTDYDPPAPTFPAVLLLEFKCPLSRCPRGEVPAHYVPQIWSGLAVSPVAHAGLFVDAVFRTCAFAELGGTATYNTRYHNRDRYAKWRDDGLPVAWGIIGVFAPLESAPKRVRFGWRADAPTAEEILTGPDADAAIAARQISAECGISKHGFVDVGGASGPAIVRMLGLINRGVFPVRRGAPCFEDGRGAELHSIDDIAEAVAKIQSNPPADHKFLGVMAWKLFEVDYSFVARRDNFLEDVGPLIREVHSAAATAVALPPAERPAFYSALAATRSSGRTRSPVENLSDTAIQGLFDSITT